MKRSLSLLYMLVLFSGQWTTAIASPDEGGGLETAATENEATKSPGYAGTDSCVACHPKQHQSYLESLHSQSFALTNANEEPAAGTFRHDLSGRTYTIRNEGGKLVHREDFTDADGSPIVSTEFPMTYTVGSGTHAKTYLYENHGFIGQSPITWYEGKGWEMSPGYDVPNPVSYTHLTLPTTPYV